MPASVDPTRRARRVRGRWFALLGIALGSVALGRQVLVEQPPTISDYEVVKAYPHDPGAFCQGLAFVDGVLYEGTGKYGASTLRKVDLESGKVLQRVPLEPKFFGEGIAVWEDKIIQLTWQSRVGIVYDRASLRERRRFSYPGEGWGLTTDGRHLIMSDGTANLRFLDPETYKETRRLTVRSNGVPLRFLNELEYVKGEIFANVLSQDFIVRISPKTGKVTGLIDLRGLRPVPKTPAGENVLNGIAYDAKSDRLFVTGKNWPKLYEVRLVPKR